LNVHGFETNQIREETAKDNHPTAAWISHSLRQQAGFFFHEQKLFFKY